MSEQESTAQDLGNGNDRAPDPMREMARAMLPELLAACGGADAPLMADPVTIPGNLARGLLAHLGASLAQPGDPEANAAYTVTNALVAHAYTYTLKRAAETVESMADISTEYAKRERRGPTSGAEAAEMEPPAVRAQRALLFKRDAETCLDIARRLRSLSIQSEEPRR